MGYTHYWKHKREFTKPEWEKVKTLAEAIFGVCKQHHVQLLSPMGSYFEEDAERDAEGNLPPNVPLVTDDEIGFNGNPDCEGFVLDRSPSERDRAFHKSHQESMRRSGINDGGQDTISFGCCKTRQHPYDIAVVAMLAGVDMLVPEVLVLSSDGEFEELERGIELARRIISTMLPGESHRCAFDALKVEDEQLSLSGPVEA